MRALRRVEGARVAAALAALVAVLAMHGLVVEHHLTAPLVGQHAGEGADPHTAPLLVLPYLTAAGDAHDCGDCGTGAHAALLLCVAVLTAAGAALALAARSRRAATHRGPPQQERRPPPSRRPRPPDLLSELCISRT